MLTTAVFWAHTTALSCCRNW